METAGWIVLGISNFLPLLIVLDYALIILQPHHHFHLIFFKIFFVIFSHNEKLFLALKMQ